MGWSEKVDAMLLGKQRERVVRFAKLFIAVAILLDAAVTILLRQGPSLVHDRAVVWNVSDLANSLSDFSNDTTDCLLLFVLRITAVLTIAVIACYVGTPKLDGVGQQNGNRIAPVSTTAPLLADVGPAGGDRINGSSNGLSSAHAANGANGALAVHSLAPPKPRSAVKEEHLESHMIKLKAEARKNVAIAAIFLTSTMAQVYVGVKCISFSGGWRENHRVMTVQGIFMGLTVFLINIEAWLVKRLINICTAEVGHMVPEFHKHPLFFHDKMPNHRCDLCRNSSTQVYRCTICDFDACPACFNKKDKSTGEGVLRGDKGIKSTGTLTSAQYLARGMKLAYPHLALFILALLCVTVTSILSLFLPNFQGQIMDHVIAGRTACTPSATEAEQNDECHDARQSFMDVVLLYIACSIALGFLGGVRSLCFNLIGRRITVSVRNTLFRSVIIQDIAFFDGMRTGDLTQRMTSDVRAMVAPVTTTLSTLISNSMLLVGGVAMCFVTSWQLSMVAYTTVLPIMHVTEAYAKWSGKINRQIFQHYSDASAATNEAISNIRTVRAVSTEAHEADKVGECLAQALRKGVRDAFFGAFSAAFNNYLDLGAGVLILWYGGSIAMSKDGSITVGSLIKYQLYWNMINNSWQALNNLINSFTRAAGAAERVLSLVDLEPDIPLAAGKRADDLHSWSVTIEEVTFRYQMRPQQTILDRLSLHVEPGTVCALVGKSGGGKSTLVHLLLRYYDPQEGRILLGGVDYRTLNLSSVHQRIGVVSQETQLFNATIAENIAYGAPAHTEAELLRAAESAQAHQFISSFEDGYATRVGERGQRLSGGQKQRIAVARALLRKPRLLCLDEATSALDAESEALVQKALDALIWTGDHTVVLVAHRLSTVVNAHAIAVVDGGRIAQTGTHAQLLADKHGIYASLVAKQMHKQAEELKVG